MNEQDEKFEFGQ